MAKLIDSYLKFLGFEGSPTTDLKTLSELHRLHTLKVPFENLTPYLYKEVVLKTEVIFDKFINQQRGGYCFEQNLLFADMLKEIGFKVRRLGARVLWNQAEELITRRSHMLLIVDVEGTEYLADVGFGGLTLTTPIKFQIGLAQETTHEDFRIERIEEDLKLQASVNGVWKTLYRFDLTEQHQIDYDVANYFLYTNPESIFRNNLIVAKPVQNGRYALGNNVFTFYPLGGEPQKKVLRDASSIKNTLVEIFGINLPQEPFLDTKIEEFLKLNP